MTQKVFFVLFGSLCLILSSCNENHTELVPNTPTSGRLSVFCEEGLYLHIKNQAYTFEQIYHNAAIQTHYLSEKKALEGLYNDCCKVIVISRKLSGEELKKFKTKNIFPTQICVAKSALAFVIAASQADSILSLEKITQFISGKDTSKKMVFDNEQSGLTYFLKDSLLMGKPFGKNCFAQKNTYQLVDFIAKEKGSIGVLDYAWLSDTDDSTTQVFLKKVKILAVSAQGNTVAFMPDQSNIKTGDYPLCRYVYAIRRSDDFSLATGFSVFVAGQKGQFMFLKQGLVPFVQPSREVEINTNPL
ncbi:MAG: substrate-binding domain-containing protein [Bacteroidetes bacterium]|nr:substrate-binding domain-containing protein [Bacteroidota bacterium]